MTNSGNHKENIILVSVGIFLTIIGFSFNEKIFFMINSANDSAIWNHFWGNITQLGDGFFAALVTVAVIRINPELTGKALFAFIFSLILSQGGKEIFGGPRPLSYFGEEIVNVIGPSLGHRSFPSGHTSTAFLVAGLFINNTVIKGSKVYLLSAALLVGISRVAVGAHFPRDVVAGMWIGLFSAYMAAYLSNKIPGYMSFWHFKKTQIFFFVASIASIPFMFINYKPSEYFPLFYITIALLVLLNSIWNIGKVNDEKINN